MPQRTRVSDNQGCVGLVEVICDGWDAVATAVVSRHRVITCFKGKLGLNILLLLYITISISEISYKLICTC